MRYPAYERGDHIIMSWDIALSEEEKGDYFACVVLLRRKEVFFVLEVIRGRLRFDDLQAQDFGRQKTLRDGDAPDRGLAHQQRSYPKPRGEFDQRYDL